MKDSYDIQMSILDRLLDPADKPGSSAFQSLRSIVGQLKNYVARDLENLLNTRRQIFEPPAECPAVGSSLYVYGLRDFTSENPGSLMVRQQLRQDIERSVAKFEPRLKNVRVYLESEAGSERKLRFRITGLLAVDPISEPVTFDTFVDMNRGQCTVLES